MIETCFKTEETRVETRADGQKVLQLLLVDDDAGFRQGMRRLLHGMRDRLACTVLEAPDGVHAMDLLQRERVDCVLLDNRMPGGNGLEWLGRMLDGHENLPVVMVTGEGDEETAVAALKSGAMDYLVKGSITPETLYRSVMNAVEKIRMRLAIEEQRQALLQAERERVMIQSIGAACHHLGQPATTLTCCLELLKVHCAQPEAKSMLNECAKAAEELGEIIHQLQHVCEYRTVAYHPDTTASSDGSSTRPDDAIIDITA